MKYNRFITLLLVFATLFSLISCKPEKPHNSHDNNIDLDDQDQELEEEGGEGKVTFYYSVNSNKFHVAGCYHLYSIVDKFLKTSTSVPDLVADGYSPCRDCIAVEEESEEDDANKITKEEATFVFSNNSSKSETRFHTLDCHNVKKIQEKNLEYTNLTFEELTEIYDYIPCKDCLPDEAKIYFEKYPEKDPSNKD